MSETPRTPPEPLPARQGARWRWFGRGAGWTLSTLVVPVLLLAAVGWLATAPAGLRILARLAVQASGGSLQLEGVEGRLAGPLRVARVEYADASLRLEARQIEMDWRPAELLRGRAHLVSLRAAHLAWASAPSADPPQPPASLGLPLTLTVDRFAVDRLEGRDWSPRPGAPWLSLADLAGQFHSDGAAHRFSEVTVETPHGHATLAGEVGVAPPFALQARLTLAGSRGGRDYTVAATLAGDVLAPAVDFSGSGGGLRGTGRVLAAPFEVVPLRQARVDLEGLDPSLFDPAWPAAALHLTATLEGGHDGALAGPVAVSNASPHPLDQGGLPLEGLRARLHWSGGDAPVVALDDVVARLPGGGQIKGQGRWGWAANTGEGRLELESTDLRRIDTRLPATRLAGRIDARGGTAEQRVEAKLADARYRLELEARQVDGQAVLDRLQVHAGGGTLTASGQAGLEGEQAFELAARLSHFNPRLLFAEAPVADLNLELDGGGRLNPEAAGQIRFRFAPSQLRGQPLSGEGHLELAAGRLVVPSLGLDLAGNRIHVAGALGGRGDHLRLEVDAPRLDALGLGAGGRLKLSGQVGGSLDDPSAEFSGDAQYLAWPGLARIGAVSLQGRLAPGRDGEVSLVLGASRLGLAGAGEDWADTLALQLSGTRRHHELLAFAARGRRDRLRAAVEGGLVAGGWEGRLREVSGEGITPLHLEAPASLVVKRDAASLGAATLSAGEGVIHLRETRWSPAATVLRGDLRGLGFGLVSTDGGPPRRGQGTLRLGAEWDLRLTDRFDGEARLYRESGDLVLVGDSVARLGLEAFEVVFSARANRLAASLQARGGQLGELAASVTAAAEKGPGGWRLAPNAALLGSARLAMPSIAWLGPLSSPGVSTEGSLEADFSLAGTPANPRATGRVSGRQLGVRMGDLGLRLTGGTLEAEFDREQLRLATLEFLTPVEARPEDRRLADLASPGGEPGRLVASGAVDLASGVGRFDFSAARLAMLQRPDRWLMASGGGRITSGWSSLDISARLKADGGFIGLAESPAPSLSDDVVVLGRGTGADATPFGLTVDINLELGPRMYLTALGVDTRLEGALRLRQRGGQPLATTGVVTAEDGTYQGYGQKLSIQRGRVTFTGTADNPALDVVALRTGLEVEAGIAITGTARRPKVKLISEPNVPDTEKLSWLVLGRPSDSASGRGDLGLLIPAAQALLGGPGGGMTAQLANSLGLDQVSFGQGNLQGTTRSPTSRVLGSSTTNGAGTVSGEVVSLGKRLSSDVFLSFEQSLAGAESIVKLTYQLSRRLALVARGGTDNAVDLTYSFSFR